MGGWNSKGKREAGNRLSIFWLRKHGFLNKECSYPIGGIKWTDGFGTESSISFSIRKGDWNKPEERDHINLWYTNTDYYSGEKENMDYQVNLTTTPCRYGGKRYWFICPLIKNGMHCGRRVGTLYSIGKWFGCRHCGNITYASRNLGGSHKGFVSDPDMDKAREDIKRCYYRGKPTRKYRRFLRLENKYYRGLLGMMGRLNKLYNRKNEV